MLNKLFVFSGSIKNKRPKHSLPINSTNFKKVLLLGLVLVSKVSRVHNLNLKADVIRTYVSANRMIRTYTSAHIMKCYSHLHKC